MLEKALEEAKVTAADLEAEVSVVLESYNKGVGKEHKVKASNIIDASDE
jgi:hypothetical protein